MRMNREHVVSRQSRKRKLLWRLATCAAATGLAVGATAGTANAGQILAYAQQGSDYGSLDIDGVATACDREADGRGVYTYVKMEYDEAWSVTDGNGSASGCTAADGTGMIYMVDYMKVCERINNLPDACSPKVYITEGD